MSFLFVTYLLKRLFDSIKSHVFSYQLWEASCVVPAAWLKTDVNGVIPRRAPIGDAPSALDMRVVVSKVKATNWHHQATAAGVDPLKNIINTLYMYYVVSLRAD